MLKPETRRANRCVSLAGVSSSLCSEVSSCLGEDSVRFGVDSHDSPWLGMVSRGMQGRFWGTCLKMDWGVSSESCYLKCYYSATENHVSHFGIPENVVSDNRQCFVSAEFSNLFWLFIEMLSNVILMTPPTVLSCNWTWHEGVLSSAQLHLVTTWLLIGDQNCVHIHSVSLSNLTVTGMKMMSYLLLWLAVPSLIHWVPSSPDVS